MSSPVTIRFRRGPYTTEKFVTLLEGEPDLEGIVMPDMTTYELFYVGGHDGQQKLVGNGCAVYPAATIQALAAPSGAIAMDPEGNLYGSTGTGWKQQSASGLVNLDCGSYWS